MKQCHYASRARQPFSADDLETLLQRARPNNLKLGITGLLVYGKQMFLQVVEGPDEAVDAMFRRISGDPRHELLMVSNRVIHERSFPDWQMGFTRLSPEAEATMPGYSAFFDPAFDIGSIPALDPIFRRMLETLRGPASVADAGKKRGSTMLSGA